jgi:hypothetical protein
MGAYSVRVDCRMGGKPRYILTDSEDPFMRVPDVLKHCVAFIGCDLGGGKKDYIGTGFLVTIPSAKSGANFQYFVTAKHVALTLDGLSIFVQHMLNSGETVQIEANDLNWTYHPDPDVDVAVLQVGEFDSDIKTAWIEMEMFADKNVLEKNGIGIGDEVIVVGLFTRLKKTVDPIIRIGNIAMIPDGKVISAEIVPGKFVPMEGYLIDQRSLGGMSGCPVFVRQTTTIPVTRGNSTPQPLHGLGSAYLLGMMHGHWKIDPQEANDVFPNKGDFPIGFSIVVPAEKIMETLNQPELKSIRDTWNAKFEQEENEHLAATPTSNVTNENPKHREDFNHLLDVAVRGKP